MILVRPITVTREMIFSSNIEENDAPEWSSTVTYAEAQEVLYQHRVWESLIDGNLNHAPDTGALADPPKWLDLGPANRYRMFDASPYRSEPLASAGVGGDGRPLLNATGLTRSMPRASVGSVCHRFGHCDGWCLSGGAIHTHPSFKTGQLCDLLQLP